MKYNNNEAGVYSPDALFIDAAYPVLTKGVALKAGQGTLQRGTVICKNSSGEYVAADKIIINVDATTSALNPVEAVIVGVLTDDVVTAGSGNYKVITTVYRTGHFNKNALKFASGTTFADIEAKLVCVGIYASTIKED